MARMNARWRREERLEDAEKRQSARDARTPVQQLALLDSRLGKNTGAKRERATLAKLIAAKSKEEVVQNKE